MATQVNSWEHLIDMMKQGNDEYFIRLNSGIRSSKNIRFVDDELDEAQIDPQTVEISVFNEVDETECVVDKSNFGEITNIQEAMQKGAFYCY